MAEALKSLNHWPRNVLPRQFADPTDWELQNMLCVARLMVLTAKSRQESRGAHVRTDFPQTDDLGWKRHIAFRR